MEYEAVIGLEVHAQLKTKTKMFTRVPYQYGHAPNALTDPVVMGLPGTLPVMNKEAIHKTVLAGKIFNCKIAQVCKWDRKNYFYPDNPKNYQISQYDQPICEGGTVEIELPGPSRNVMGEHKKIHLTRIHLEEDVGKLTHFETDSLVDYNRAGAPLIEIVTEPDMHTADEVFAFLTSLKMHLLYAGISDCDMEKGQLRCDANISVRPKGSDKLGTKVEIKNLNSFSGVRNGVTYEIERQINAIRNGEPIAQETRRWNAEKGFTTPMRSKEMAHDYRYFPDPDLMPVVLKEDTLQELTKDMPELPFAKQERFFKQYDLPYTITSVLCPVKELADFFEASVAGHKEYKMAANFIANDLLRELSSSGVGGMKPIAESPITPSMLSELVTIVEKGDISKQIAQDVFIEMFTTGKTAASIVEEKGLKQTSDAGELQGICQEVINNNQKAANEFREGNDKAINALKGQVMKVTKGKANPAMVDELLKKLLS